MSNRGGRKFYFLGALLAAIALLIFLNYIGWLAAPRNILFNISTPTFHFFRETFGVKIFRITKLIFNFGDLAGENEKLINENQQLLLKLTNLSQVEDENRLLRFQLQIDPPLKSKLILADIIGYDPGNLGNYFFINRGLSDRIKINQAVIFAGGFLIGRIVEVNENLSKVMALSDSDSAVFAVTQKTNVGGVIRGDHGVGLILDMVPFEKNLSDGEMIVSSGLDGQVPKDLIIGKIEAKISSESEVFQRFKIEPAINFREIESVFVIIE